MKDFLLKFIKEEDGATIIEYVLMLAAAAGLVVFLVPNLKNQVVGYVKKTFGNIDKGIAAEDCQTGFADAADGTGCQPL